MLPHVIEDLEHSRDLLLRESQEAGARGDWNLARKLIDLAEQADRLRIGVQNLTGESLPVRESSSTPAPAGTQEEYPRFCVRDNQIIKLGRQRDGVREYEHAVPWDRYDQIMRIISDLATGRRNNPQKPLRFEMIQGQLDYPQYQARVIVSLLVRKKLLVVARKGSYRFTSPATFESDVANLWDNLKGEHA